MTITVKKQIEETFHVDTPSAWYNSQYGRHYLIKENGEVVHFNELCVLKWCNDSTRFRDESIAEALKGERVDYDETVEKLETILESFSQKVAY